MALNFLKDVTNNIVEKTKEGAKLIKNKIDDPKFQEQVKLIANKTMNTVGNVSSDIYNKAIEQKMAYEISNICKNIEDNSNIKTLRKYAVDLDLPTNGNKKELCERLTKIASEKAIVKLGGGKKGKGPSRGIRKSSRLSDQATAKLMDALIGISLEEKINEQPIRKSKKKNIIPDKFYDIGNSRLNTLINLAVNGTPESWQPTWFANQLIKFELNVEQLRQLEDNTPISELKKLAISKKIAKILFNDKKRKSAEKAQQTRRERQGEASTSAPPSTRESTPMEGLEDDNNQKEIDYIASMLDNL